MKKESISRVLQVIFAIALISVIVEFVGYAIMFNDYVNFSAKDKLSNPSGLDYSVFNSLKADFTWCLVLGVFVLALLIVMFVINLLKFNPKQRRMINCIILGAILILSVVSIIIAVLATKRSNLTYYTAYKYPEFSEEGYEFASLFMTQNLGIMIPSIIFVCAGFLSTFQDKIFKNVYIQANEQQNDVQNKE